MLKLRGLGAVNSTAGLACTDFIQSWLHSAMNKRRNVSRIGHSVSIILVLGDLILLKFGCTDFIQSWLH